MILFSALDSNGDGFITYQDLLRVLEEKMLPLSEIDCRALMGKLDKEKTGSVHFGEFLRSLNTDTHNSILDQMHRTIVGVRRGGGTVYRTVRPTEGSSSRSVSTTTSSIVSITGAIQDHMRSFRAPSDRLDYRYNGLIAPRRHLPWEDYTKHTVQPCEWIPGNPQVMSDSVRHLTTSMYFRDSGMRESSLSTRKDSCLQQRPDLRRSSRTATVVDATHLASQRERVADELDQRRVAYKSACIMDYHNRVGGKYCHIA